MRWRSFSVEFDFTVTNKNGTQKTHTDAPSGQKTMGLASFEREGEKISCYTVSTESTDDTIHETYGIPLWGQGVYITKKSELDSPLLSDHSQEPLSGRDVLINA